MLAEAIRIYLFVISVILAADTCTDDCQPPDCICPSTTPPGQIDRDETPQFVILYTDELMTEATFSRIVELTKTHKNLNGCYIPITWYIRSEHSNADMIRNAYNRYYEIAITAAAEGGDIQSQITKARDWLVQSAQIPAQQIIGFRAPKWSNAIGSRSILREIGFKYDHSILESVQNPGERHWPYTMDFGVAEDCSDPDIMCDARERHPGLAEIPVWEFRDRHNKTGKDVKNGSPGDALYSNPDWASLLAFNFAASFYGNRAPVSIPLSKILLESEGKLEVLNNFIGQVLEFENVWIVTNTQLVSYMRTPKDVQQVHELLTCSNRAEENSCLPPTAGCARGTFDFQDCICECENNDNRNVPGFCIDNYQRCTVETVYSEDSKVYYCKDPEPLPIEQPVVYGLGPGGWLISLYVLLAVLAIIGLWKGIQMGRRRAQMLRSNSQDYDEL